MGKDEIERDNDSVVDLCMKTTGLHQSRTGGDGSQDALALVSESVNESVSTLSLQINRCLQGKSSDADGGC